MCTLSTAYTWCFRLQLFTALAISLGLSGCSGDAGYKPVDFSDAATMAYAPVPKPERERLRVAVAAMISPQETFIYYRELIDYIGERLDKDIELVQRKTYGEINEMLRKGQIDLAFICSGPYAAARERFDFEGLAAPMIRGNPYYQSYLIVGKKSPYQQLEDLKGAVFAFTDPDSNTGALVPTYWLSLLHESASSFFRNTTYTYSHDNSILAVARQLVDAAAVDGHKWEYYHRRNPFYTDATRIIKKSKLFGSPPLVASKSLDESVKAVIRNTLHTMHTAPEGSRILQGLMIDRFVLPRDEWYQPVRDMYSHLGLAQK